MPTLPQSPMRDIIPIDASILLNRKGGIWTASVMFKGLDLSFHAHDKSLDTVMAALATLMKQHEEDVYQNLLNDCLAHEPKATT